MPRRKPPRNSLPPWTLNSAMRAATIFAAETPDLLATAAHDAVPKAPIRAVPVPPGAYRMPAPAGPAVVRVHHANLRRWLAAA